MPKKKKPESQKEQSARFRAEVERMIVAGELNPTEAAERMDKMLSVASTAASAQAKP